MLNFIQAQQTWWEWLNYWMSQDSSSWHPIAWAVDNNPIVIGMHLVAGTVMALTFFFIGAGLIYQTKKQGFANTEHKWVSIFFITFIWLCGFTFVIREITFFMPIFWIYGAVKLTTALFAFLTSLTYGRMLPYLVSMPSLKEFAEVKDEKAVLENQAAMLNEHITSWTEDVGHHISILKSQQKQLSKELASKGIPVTTLEDIHDSCPSKAEILNSLEKMKLELEDLLDKIKEEFSQK